MGFFAEKIGSIFRGSKKAKVPLGSDFAISGLSEPQFSDYNLLHAKKAGYTGNEIFYAAMQVLISAFIQAPLKVWDGNETVIPNHQFRRLIRKPNPFMGEKRMWELTLLHLFLTGNCFKVKFRNGGGRVVEEWILDPTRIRIVTDDKKFISHYVYEAHGEDYPIMPEDMTHHKFEDPNDPYFGVAPFKVTYKQIQTDNEANDMTKSILENKAMPGVVVTTQEEITKERADTLKAKWRQAFGKGKRGDVAFLQKGMEVTDFPINIKDLEFPNLRDISETRICAVIGVPPILVGIRLGLTSGTYSNAKQFRQLFYENRVIPLFLRVADDYMMSYEKDFGLGEDKAELRFDISKIPSLREWRDQLMDQLDKGVKNGSVKRAEFRRALNLEVTAADEGFLVPNSHRYVSDKVKPSDKLEAPKPLPAPVGPKPGAPKPKPKSKAVLDQIESNVNRIEASQGFENSIYEWAKAEFVDEGLDILEAINTANKSIDFDALDVLLTSLLQKWIDRIEKGAEPVLSSVLSDAIDLVSQTMELGVVPAGEIEDYIKAYTIHFAREISKTTEEVLRTILLEARQKGWPIDQLVDSIKETFTDWSQDRAMLVARTEVIRTSNAGAVLSFKQAGVKEYEWLTTDVPCPYCAPLNGKKIKMGEFFFRKGDVYKPSEDATPITLKYDDVAFPPLHPNCRCTVVPVIGVPDGN